jgi:hypothetical protein
MIERILSATTAQGGLRGLLHELTHACAGLRYMNLSPNPLSFYFGSCTNSRMLVRCGPQLQRGRANSLARDGRALLLMVLRFFCDGLALLL